MLSFAALTAAELKAGTFVGGSNTTFVARPYWSTVTTTKSWTLKILPETGSQSMFAWCTTVARLSGPHVAGTTTVALDGEGVVWYGASIATKQNAQTFTPIASALARYALRTKTAQACASVTA